MSSICSGFNLVDDFASSNVCHVSAQSLGLTDYTIGFFASVSSNLNLFVTGGNTSLPVVSFNNSLVIPGMSYGTVQ